MNRLSTCIFIALIASLPTLATTIDFEAQGASTPPAFTGALNSPLTVGIATFHGGQLLNNEANSIDASAVYATGGAAPYLNPLTIAFSQPVSAFSLLVTNNVPDTYTAADNLGGSQSLALNANVAQIFSLTDTRITGVSISSAATVFWDFAIDNVTFSPVSAAVPEPATFTPIGAVLLSGIFLVMWGGHPRRAGSPDAACRTSSQFRKG
jgi:hypothetical protein